MGIAFGGGTVDLLIVIKTIKIDESFQGKYSTDIQAKFVGVIVTSRSLRNHIHIRMVRYGDRFVAEPRDAAV